MCTYFCETFCCFFLQFRDWLYYPRDNVAGDAHLESGDSIYALPNLRPRYQQEQPQPPAPLPMPTIYPGGPPAPKRPLPPRLNPRSVPLPVRYPPTETPTGKHFRHRSAPPNRMKPLPPLRTTFDGGGGVESGRGKGGGEKPATSSSNATFSTPAPAYFSAAPSETPAASAVSVPKAGGGGGFPFLRELDKPFSVERQRGRLEEAKEDFHLPPARLVEAGI
ncbi:MAG: hypothetical protein Q9215_003102 [Flavoplaca cf. flavocitrina]